MVRRVGNQLIPNGGPVLGIDQRRMLPGVELALVRNLTDVDGVRQQMVDVSAGEGSAAALAALRRHAAFCDESETVGLLLDPTHAAELTIKGEDATHGLGLGRVDHERALARVVTERRPPHQSLWPRFLR